jgi:hypothetical protein
LLDTVNGLPAHPLLAHVVAIFVPLTALLAVLVVLWPAVRRRVNGAPLFVAAGTLIAIPLTTTAGDWLRQSVMDSEILRRHAALGAQLVFWFGLLTIAMVLWWALHTPLFANEVATLSPWCGTPLSRSSGQQLRCSQLSPRGRSYRSATVARKRCGAA